MNKYVLYSQSTRQSFFGFEASCRDVFRTKGSTELYMELKLLKDHGQKFAIVDPNGSVLQADLNVVQMDLIKDVITVRTLLLKEIS